MPDYKEIAVTGKTWVRAHRVIVENPIVGDKSVAFIEERVTELSDGTRHQATAGEQLRETALDMSTIFPLLNPADDSEIGQMTYGELYAALYSLHRFLALKRDSEASE